MALDVSPPPKKPDYDKPIADAAAEKGDHRVGDAAKAIHARLSQEGTDPAAWSKAIESTKGDLHNSSNPAGLQEIHFLGVAGKDGRDTVLESGGNTRIYDAQGNIDKATDSRWSHSQSGPRPSQNLPDTIKYPGGKTGEITYDKEKPGVVSSVTDVDGTKLERTPEGLYQRKDFSGKAQGPPEALNINVDPKNGSLEIVDPADQSRVLHQADGTEIQLANGRQYVNQGESIQKVTFPDGNNYTWDSTNKIYAGADKEEAALDGSAKSATKIDRAPDGTITVTHDDKSQEIHHADARSTVLTKDSTGQLTKIAANDGSSIKFNRDDTSDPKLVTSIEESGANGKSTSKYTLDTTGTNKGKDIYSLDGTDQSFQIKTDQSLGGVRFSNLGENGDPTKEGRLEKFDGSVVSFDAKGQPTKVQYPDGTSRTVDSNFELKGESGKTTKTTAWQDTDGTKWVHQGNKLVQVNDDGTPTSAKPIENVTQPPKFDPNGDYVIHKDGKTIRTHTDGTKEEPVDTPPAAKDGLGRPLAPDGTPLPPSHGRPGHEVTAHHRQPADAEVEPAEGGHPHRHGKYMCPSSHLGHHHRRGHEFWIHHHPKHHRYKKVL